MRRIVFWLTAIVAAFLLVSIAVNAHWWPHTPLNAWELASLEALAAVICGLIASLAARRKAAVGGWLAAVLVFGFAFAVLEAWLAAETLKGLSQALSEAVQQAKTPAHR